MSPNLPPRPSFHVSQGRFFRYSHPPGWSVTETASAVHLRAPDGVAGASLTQATGAAGFISPPTYLRSMLQVLGIAGLDFITARELPDLTGAGGETWRVTEAELTYLRGGTIVRAHLLCAICQASCGYTAVTREYHTAQRDWWKHRTWLPRVAGSLTSYKPEAGQDAVLFPAPSLAPVYDEYTPLWVACGIPSERIVRSRRQGTLGYDQVLDPLSGHRLEVPFEEYCPALAGYPHPSCHGEVLTPCGVLVSREGWTEPAALPGRSEGFRNSWG